VFVGLWPDRRQAGDRVAAGAGGDRLLLPGDGAAAETGGAIARELFTDIDPDRAPGDAAAAADAPGAPELIPPRRELVRQPLAVAIARPGSKVAPRHFRERHIEARVPLPLGGAGLASMWISRRPTCRSRSGRTWCSCRIDAAVRNLRPARVVELPLEAVADAVHSAAVRPSRFGPPRRRRPRRRLRRDSAAASAAWPRSPRLRGTRLDDKAVLDLGQEDVVAAADFRPRPHRCAEARCSTRSCTGPRR